MCQHDEFFDSIDHLQEEEFQAYEARTGKPCKLREVQPLLPTLPSTQWTRNHVAKVTRIIETALKIKEEQRVREALDMVSPF